ncbi:hypothetical protein ADIWIN_1360 [Winogradskyella psychrotolerans RS-3]|uniref:Uncharacterized protein n=1 Tax=Winogradskyella psychrotolerans RS-3 TaxID=641526 RepID=S7XCK9_9FLAO|nr:hypothetical protein [Winogradskyella psychrotolerans]EPR73723.1 hypothetical protein ADIWIN_1360 [Winogradskyella psychrotolerans RS-3]
MIKVKKEFILKYGVPSLAVIIVAIQLCLVHFQDLSRWKGGGFGMYTEIHYFYNQIHVSGMSVDSLIKDDPSMRSTLGYLMLMPNDKNIKKAAELVLKTTHKDSVYLQIWKPIVNSENGLYKKVLANEIHLKKSEL